MISASNRQEVAYDSDRSQGSRDPRGDGNGLGVARAQTAEPAFELVVDAPVGATTITCVKGCTLAWVERGVNPNSQPMPTFSYKCNGPNVERCSSRKVGGWITP